MYSQGYAERYGFEGAAVNAIQYPGHTFEHAGIAFFMRGDALIVRLLSGRELTYHEPRLEPSTREYAAPGELFSFPNGMVIKPDGLTMVVAETLEQVHAFHAAGIANGGDADVCQFGTWDNFQGSAPNQHFCGGISSHIGGGNCRYRRDVAKPRPTHGGFDGEGDRGFCRTLMGLHQVVADRVDGQFCVVAQT